jgi:thiosulfate reductase cytochrome b subunit
MWVSRLLPAMALAAAVVGVIVVLPLVNHDQASSDWYRGLLGGSRLYKVNVIFARLVPFLIGAAVALALLQRGRQQTRTVEMGESLRRHELSEVAGHWLNAAGIGIGLITAAWLLRWIDRPFSLETTYIIHFVGAGLTLAAVAHHVTYELAGGGTGLLPRRKADFKNALAELIGYTGVYRGMRGAFGIQLPVVIRRPIQRVLRRLNVVPDPAGKYLATEKVLSYTVWLVLIGLIVVTGIVKTLHYVLSVPGWLLQPMTFLHDGATIFLLVFLAIHVSALVFVPRNWPLLKSMVTTRISRAYANQHLPLWVEEEGGTEES